MNLRHNFYVQPMEKVYMETIAIYATWTFLMLLLRGKARRIAGVIGAFAAVALILLFTLWGRSAKSSETVCLIPFASFSRAKAQPELLRTMYMNVLLFMPFGLSLPFALSGRIKHNILTTVLCGAAISACVEALQFLFRIGKCEIDDVLMNTLGVLIGVTSCLLAAGFTRLIKLMSEHFDMWE